MQKERTLQYWDDYHREHDSKEWILQPTPEVLKMIHSHFPRTEKPLRILEIGCGTSTMARDLWLYAAMQQEGEQDGVGGTYMCATDVSPACIKVNKERDDGICSGFQGSTSKLSLEYRVLNILDGNKANDEPPWDVIVDKGCLDTFMFRSRQRGENHEYCDLLQRVLDNLWRWMDDAGVYLLISPRPRLKAVRDYAGFASVEKHAFETESSAGALVGREKRDGKQCPGKRNPDGYIYVCRKNASYFIGQTPAFNTKINHREVPLDDAECINCGVNFFDFRRGEAVEGRGVVFWTRQWTGHCQHCKGL